MFKEKVCRQGRCGQVQEQDAIQNIFLLQQMLHTVNELPIHYWGTSLSSVIVKYYA